MRDKRFEAPNRFEKMDIARSKKCNPQKTPRRLSLCDDSFLKNDHVLNEPYSNDEFFNCIFVYIGGQHSIGVDLIAAAVEMTEGESLLLLILHCHYKPLCEKGLQQEPNCQKNLWLHYFGSRLEGPNYLL